MNEGEKLQKFIDDCCKGNRGSCASILGISESTISRIINGKNNAGRRMIAKMMKYCIENSIDFKEYISF